MRCVHFWLRFSGLAGLPMSAVCTSMRSAKARLLSGQSAKFAGSNLQDATKSYTRSSRRSQSATQDAHLLLRWLGAEQEAKGVL